MKSLMIAASAATALATAFALPVAAHAQSASTFSPVTVYGSVGYSGISGNDVDLGAIQARLGARFGSYVGVEGELAGGVKDDTVNVAGTDVQVKLRHEEAAYGVGFVPVTPKFDLFARVGYGHQDIKASAAGVSNTGGLDSWNYGGGGQYFFDNNNGVRLDYTRHDFTHDNGAANVWSIGYVRKF
jgi:outer membrane immunogenic protein